MQSLGLPYGQKDCGLKYVSFYDMTQKGRKKRAILKFNPYLADNYIGGNQMISWLKNLMGPKKLKLTNAFKRQVYIAADGAEMSKQSESEMRQTHYGLLNSDLKAQYKKTPQYNFLSEFYNDVPDLSLRAMSRKDVLNDL